MKNGPRRLTVDKMKLDSNLRYRVVGVEVDCEACERGYRLNPNGLHYNDERGGATWGVCRKLSGKRHDYYYWLDRRTRQPLTYKDGREAQWKTLDEAISAFTDGQLTVERNEVME